MVEEVNVDQLKIRMICNLPRKNKSKIKHFYFKKFGHYVLELLNKNQCKEAKITQANDEVLVLMMESHHDLR